MRLSSFVSVSAVLSTTAAIVPSTHGVHEQRDVHPSRWMKLGRVRPEAILPVRIALAQNNLDKGYEYLMDVSHPHSPNYGKHWTAEEVINTFRPSDADVEAVRGWLVGSGIPFETITHSDNKAIGQIGEGLPGVEPPLRNLPRLTFWYTVLINFKWLAFDASTSKVEKLLHTEYHEYQDRRSGGVMPACNAYHVPKNIQPLIDYITPGIKLLAPTDELIGQGRQYPEKRGFTAPLGSGSVPDKHAPEPVKKWHSIPMEHSMSPYGGLDQSDLSQCDTVITPACVAALYQIPPAPNYVDPSNTMGIFETGEQYWDQLDLDLFFTDFANWIPNGTHPIDNNVDGGVAQTTNVSEAGSESMLDLQLAYPIVHPQKITVWDVDDAHYQRETRDNTTYTWGFNTLLDAIDGSYCNYSAYGATRDSPNLDPTYPDPDGYNGTLECGTFKPTNVISISYGGQEDNVPIAYQKRQCDEYLKLGLQGVSFLFASGDSGVGNFPEPYGTSGPTGCLGPEHNIFNPTWPSNCPYVTNVGATKVYPGRTVFEPESAVYDPAGHPFSLNFSSGGGFSNVYPTPDYQQSAVATYFAEHDPGYPGYPYYSGLAQHDPSDIYAFPNVTLLAGDTGGIYNRIGRGIPDVAANGDNIATYYGGIFGLNGGTSASTPIFAGIINRINEERIAVGKSTLGFLNPALYAHPEILNDIINGTNPACNEEGFYAVKGWDPVTGLGTPNYPKMLAFFMSLP
ncbi:Pro-kumamolisin [Diaporthe helianthi]|uniref:Pro-kumamolisin n=1 Tax=Diaporthe helianthi TaxID=158607 RepID=A0A2P5I2J0_DIAHE|nr:Pro-kumamolisin [Diaporthe helianthi]